MRFGTLVIATFLIGMAPSAGADVYARWPTAPANPEALGPGPRPRLVLLHATWCQWCRVFAAEVLADPQVQRFLSERVDVLTVDVDVAPRWQDLPGVIGLPSLVFFDRSGKRLFTYPGYADAERLRSLVERALTEAGTATASEATAAVRSQLPAAAIPPSRAAAALASHHHWLFFHVNSIDGGFGSEGRHPYPGLLLELLTWRRAGGPAEIDRWLQRTVASALRGGSPRLLEGIELPPPFDAATLIRYARLGPERLSDWRERAEELETIDPYVGLRDPIEFGFYRYAAGPGWQHPHYERIAADNLRWILILRTLQPEAATATEEFVRRHLLDERGVRASQTANPFYARLRVAERRRVPAPAVAELYLLRDQALAARVWPDRCPSLVQVVAAAERLSERWPPGVGPDAAPDSLGELLVALAGCGEEGRALGQRLAQDLTARWHRVGLPATPRLQRLAAGFCAVGIACGRALHAVAALPFDPRWPPPLAAFAGAAGSGGTGVGGPRP